VVCHDTLTYGDFPDYGPAICRGFFDAYKDKSPALILLRAYQRLAEAPARQSLTASGEHPDLGNQRHQPRWRTPSPTPDLLVRLRG
jgi:hypothetical protein